MTTIGKWQKVRVEGDEFIIDGGSACAMCGKGEVARIETADKDGHVYYRPLCRDCIPTLKSSRSYIVV